MADSLLFVTQVAPYADGPAGVHGVLDQAAVGVAQIAELHGLEPQRVDDVRTLPTRASATPGRSRCSRSARRRGARRNARVILDRVRAGALVGARDPLRDRLVLRRGTSTARSSAPASTAIRGRRRSPPTCSTRRTRRARTSAPSGEWHDEVYQFRDLRPDAQVLLRVRDGELDLDAPGARPPSFGYPLAWCFAEGAGRVFSTSLGHFPARGRARPTCATSPAASRGRWATTERAESHRRDAVLVRAIGRTPRPSACPRSPPAG